jgi:archaellin
MMFKDFLKDRMPIKSQAKYVEFGFGQVEPNHLSAQRTGQIYAQLPAAPTINVLEQGQFVKYDYAANGNGIGEVNFTGKGEWMMVYNEIKLYRNHPDGSKQWDCEFAMVKDDYQARIYSPYDYEAPELEYHNGLYLNGKDEKGNTSITVNRAVTLNADGKTVDVAGTRINVEEKEGKVVFTYNGEEYELVNGTAENVPVTYAYDDVTKDVEDIYEWGFTNDPWKKLGIAREKKMPAGTTMVPRVFKTNVGDIMTTNTINEETLAIGDLLTPGATDGILAKAGAANADMQWQVVKLYDMPDGQKAAKVMRIK